MRINTTLRTAAVAATLALALAGCSEAEEAASKAADKAGEAASDAAASAKDKAGEAASDAAASAKDKAGEAAANAKDKASDKASDKGSGGTSGVTVDYGDFADDADAKAAVGFYEARSIAIAESDAAGLEDAAVAPLLERATAFVERHSGESGKYTVSVVDVKNGEVQVCAGADGTKPRVITVEGGKASANDAGDHTC